MTLSMTGFSSTTLVLYQEHDKDHKNPIHLTITLKTLNSRFFETNFKIPHALASLEPLLIKYLKSKLYRGSIHLTLHMSNIHTLNSIIKPNFSVISNYRAAVNSIQKEYNIQGTLTLESLLALPHIFETEEQPLKEELKDKLLQAIYILTDQLIQARICEGLALKEDLVNRITIINNYINKLKPRALEIIEKKKELFLEHITTIKEHLKESGESAPSSIGLTHQLDKIDIHEEIIRFENHIQTFLTCLQCQTVKEKGKKLDFTLQELFREINTIAAKCSDSEISALAINIKVELEKAREQTQNIV